MDSFEDANIKLARISVKILELLKYKRKNDANEAIIHLLNYIISGGGFILLSNQSYKNTIIRFVIAYRVDILNNIKLMDDTTSDFIKDVIIKYDMFVLHKPMRYNVKHTEIKKLNRT